MQPTWGPRVFWFVVFLLVVAGVFAFFYEPQPELGRLGNAGIVENVLHVSPKLIGFELEVGSQDREPTAYTTSVVLSSGKVLQVNPVGRTANWSNQGNRFNFSTRRGAKGIEPVTLQIVCEADPTATLDLALNESKQTLPLTETSPGKSNELFSGKARLRRTAAVQMYWNETTSDDVAPCVTSDAAGNAYLVYLNCAKTRGVDINTLVAGSFDSLERPITAATIRLSRYAQGAWQHSEPVGPSVESIIDPVAAVDGTGRMFVAWSQLGNDGSDIYYTFKELSPQGDAVVTWSAPQKLTARPGTHQDLVAVADSKGNVWLAWQTWHYDHFEIYAAVLNDAKHAWAKPGPVAEHSKEEEGRWNPTLAADGQGNVYVAWNVFRGGHFDVQMVRLGDNTTAAKPMSLAASERQETRPHLRCDSSNNLWIAYEESDESGEAPHFATPELPRTKIRVRVMRPDARLEDVPPVPRPLRRAVAGRSDGSPPACVQPRLVTTAAGVSVCFESQRRLYVTRLRSEGWSEPEELAALPLMSGSPAAVVQQEGQICALFESEDYQGHARLCLATQPEGPAGSFDKRTAVTPEVLTSKESTEWRRFFEIARQFRKRPEDLVLFKQYFLRGLFLSEQAARDLGSDAWGVTRTALEQGMYDWVMLPKSTDDPPALQWLSAQRAATLTREGERRILTGFFRPLTGQREPIFVFDSKQLNSPLPSLARLQTLIQGEVRVEGLGSQALDQRMLNQYLAQYQEVGFLLSDDWRLLAAMNKPTTASAFAENGDRSIVPFWYPAADPGRPAPLGVRVIAFAKGKTYDDLVEALKERHFYIATDDIHLVARCERRMPGEVFQTAFRPKISVVAQGTGKLAKVEVWQDDKLVLSEEPPGAASVLEYENKNADNAWHSYTVRVLQADGAMAITQPLWIRFQP